MYHLLDMTFEIIGTVKNEKKYFSIRRAAQGQEPTQIAKKEKRWNLPKHELVALARCFLPDILAFYETEEGQREYEEWMKTRNLS